MPYKSEKIKIAGTRHDKRVKLSLEDKERMKEVRRTQGLGYARLGKMFGVSKRTAYWVINPDKLEENLKRRQERGGWKQYYIKEVNTEAVRENRRYKQDLFLKGKIKTENNM